VLFGGMQVTVLSGEAKIARWRVSCCGVDFGKDCYILCWGLRSSAASLRLVAIHKGVCK
jgi:hypothetical protein